MLLGEGADATNNVYQIPYVIDVAGSMLGTRTQVTHLLADPNYVMVQFDSGYAMSLGAMESATYSSQHQVLADGDAAICNLFLGLEWSSADSLSKMQAHIARGSPYSSMVYQNATPRIVQTQSLKKDPLVDASASAPSTSSRSSSSLTCGNTTGSFSETPVLVEKYVELQFNNDMTWLVFFSEPTLVECSSTAAGFELRPTQAMQRGMVRVALANNCTTGTSALYCEVGGKPRDQSAFTQMLIERADVYPTAAGSVEYFPDSSSGTVDIRFDWQPALMSDLSSSTERAKQAKSSGDLELITFAVPHHQSQLVSLDTSSNTLFDFSVTPTLHGAAKLVSGNEWSLVQVLHPVSLDFGTSSPREEMMADIQAALAVDLLYEIPENYRYGAGDTYFPGKMLAKLGRVLVVAEAAGYDTKSDVFQAALTRLKEGAEVWLNGSAAAPFLYDPAWGGLASCGCNYNGETNRCNNVYPDCPALSDSGQNFGFGFYNDHHFHLGYHIYGAAVIANYDPAWAKLNFENVLVFVRDIANPSPDDAFFTTWRHKDWYLGFSWASGVVTANNKPYMNGRNEESSSEAVAAYEAVALFGQICAEKVFIAAEDQQNLAVAERVRDVGLVLLTTEITGAQTYWHVQAPGTEGVSRIYPELYANKVVGMLWSLLAQMQTWFGTTPYLCYGIQLIPITAVTDARDPLGWVNEMLPLLSQSCTANKAACDADGWSVNVYTSMAAVGDWMNAWQGVQTLADEVFESAGGNGHSRTNTLWYIATHGK